MYLIRDSIIKIIDWFYTPFKQYIPLQTFRYIATGGSNTAFDIILYFISYNFILEKKIVDLKFIAISPHIAALFMSFPISFSTGFLLAKYITFQDSFLRGRIQLFRYFVTVIVCIVLNYVFMKLFVELCHIYPTPSKILTTCLVVIYSYISQKYYTFKTESNNVPNEHYDK